MKARGAASRWTDTDRRAFAWLFGPTTGLSAECLWRTMMGVPEPDGPRCRYHPLDEADRGRCMALLEAVPEWRERLSEMRAVSPEWDAAVDLLVGDGDG